MCLLRTFSLHTFPLNQVVIYTTTHWNNLLKLKTTIYALLRTSASGLGHVALSEVPCALEEIPYFTEKIRTLIILKSNSSEKLSETLVTAVSNKLSYKQTGISSRHMTLCCKIDLQVLDRQGILLTRPVLLRM